MMITGSMHEQLANNVPNVQQAVVNVETGTEKGDVDRKTRLGGAGRLGK